MVFVQEKLFKNLKIKKLTKTFFKNLGFSSPMIICILMQPVKRPNGPLLLNNEICIPIGVALKSTELARTGCAVAPGLCSWPRRLA